MPIICWVTTRHSSENWNCFDASAKGVASSYEQSEILEETISELEDFTNNKSQEDLKSSITVYQFNEHRNYIYQQFVNCDAALV